MLLDGDLLRRCLSHISSLTYRQANPLAQPPPEPHGQATSQSTAVAKGKAPGGGWAREGSQID